MKLGPFNAADPYDATAERLRVLVCDAALSIMNTRDYKRLTAAKQIEALLAGITTGMMTVTFAGMQPEGREEITAFIKTYIDQARVLVENIQPAEGSVQ
jgi:hypothetical protein